MSKVIALQVNHTDDELVFTATFDDQEVETITFSTKTLMSSPPADLSSMEVKQEESQHGEHDKTSGQNDVKAVIHTVLSKLSTYVINKESSSKGNLSTTFWKLQKVRALFSDIIIIREDYDHAFQLKTSNSMLNLIRAYPDGFKNLWALLRIYNVMENFNKTLLPETNFVKKQNSRLFLFSGLTDELTIASKEIVNDVTASLPKISIEKPTHDQKAALSDEHAVHSRVIVKGLGKVPAFYHHEASSVCTSKPPVLSTQSVAPMTTVLTALDAVIRGNAVLYKEAFEEVVDSSLLQEAVTNCERIKSLFALIADQYKDILESSELGEGDVLKLREELYMRSGVRLRTRPRVIAWLAGVQQDRWGKKIQSQH